VKIGRNFVICHRMDLSICNGALQFHSVLAELGHSQMRATEQRTLNRQLLLIGKFRRPSRRRRIRTNPMAP
jgi:hypothetical protein